MTEQQAILRLKEPLVHLLGLIQAQPHLKDSAHWFIDLAKKAIEDTSQFDGMEHDLYTDRDEDCPNAILDRNGEVVLSFCKRCRQGEGGLGLYCLPRAEKTSSQTPANVMVNDGALTLALNVLRRAGKTEVADELEKTIDRSATHAN